jgi:polyisoprenoid-binding protein YceI
MSRRNTNIIAAIVGLVVLAAAVFGVVWFTRGGSGEASQAITAPTLEIASQNDDQPAAAETEEAADTTEAEPNPTEEADAAADATQEASAAEGTLFEIVSEESEVNFQIDETLMGSPVTVVGATNEVAGQIFVNYDNPSASQVGTIRINMRTLTTDNEFRNRALRNDILLTNQDQFEFSDFVPTSIEGMPETVTIGEPFTFQLTGNLTLRGTPQPITFDVTVTPVSEDRIEGTATSIINYEEVGVDIPRVPPSVANIGEEVTLNINFVATAVGG